MKCWLCEDEITPDETNWTLGEAGLAWHWLCMQISENPGEYDLEHDETE